MGTSVEATLRAVAVIEVTAAGTVTEANEVQEAEVAMAGSLATRLHCCSPGVSAPRMGEFTPRLEWSLKSANFLRTRRLRLTLWLEEQRECGFS